MRYIFENGDSLSGREKEKKRREQEAKENKLEYLEIYEHGLFFTRFVLLAPENKKKIYYITYHFACRSLSTLNMSPIFFVVSLVKQRSWR